MSASGKSKLFLVISGIFAAYLAADLFMFHGPLRKGLRSAIPALPAPAARVGGYPITRSQLDRAVEERLWSQGKAPADVSADELAITRQTALDELIDDALLRLQTRALKNQLPVSDAEVDAAVARFASRFASPETLSAAMKSQGIPDETALRDRLSGRIQQEKFLALRLGPATRVTEEEARLWFEKNAASLANPARINARHLFIATLDHPPEEAKQKLEAALAELTEKKKDFATLAAELSDDPATKDKGGALGWMSRDRLPADFAAPVFELEMNQPTLVRSRLGWHLVEVIDRKPEQPRTFDQAKPEILAALEAKKRRDAIAQLRQSLRQRQAAAIEILTPPAKEPTR